MTGTFILFMRGRLRQLLLPEGATLAPVIARLVKV
jgi:hypothetical protein